MQCDIQKASLWKRFAAALLDFILLAILMTGFLAVLSGLFRYDSYVDKVVQIEKKYAQQYDFKYELTQEELAAMPADEQKAYRENMARLDLELQEDPEAYGARVEAANKALYSNKADMKISVTAMVLPLVMVSIAILLSMVLLEFVVPLLFGDGRTVGKKIFSLCLVRKDSVKISTLQLFARTVLGKYAVGIMIPVCVFFMLSMSLAGTLTLLLAVAVIIAQLVSIVVTKDNCLLHDLLAVTVVVDQSTQMIFSSAQEMEEYRNKIIAEREARQLY